VAVTGSPIARLNEAVALGYAHLHAMLGEASLARRYAEESAELGETSLERHGMHRQVERLLGQAG
jgi:hypothetical protein